MGPRSRSANPDANRYSSTAHSGSSLVQACIDSNVGNPRRAVDTCLTNFATFGSAASPSCPPTLRVQLEGAPLPTG